jgi:glycosyltransferase involved in cell wall biosynthesis
MALGKPVVVTDVGGLSEVVTDGEQGFLVPAGDASALAEPIERLLLDAELRRRMGDNARTRARDFDIRVAVASMERAYERLLREPRWSTSGAAV